MNNKIIGKHFSSIIEQLCIFNRHSQRSLYQSFDDKYDKKLWIIFLYFSQIELFRNVQTLLLNKNPISIPMLVRNAIDILTTMRLCDQDGNGLVENYKFQLDKDIDNVKSFYKRQLAHGLSKSSSIDAIIVLDELSLRNSELSDIKKKKLFEVEKRKRAKTSEDMEFLYSELSAHVHNSHDILALRHGMLKNGKYKASNKQAIDKSIIYFYLHGLLLCLESSIIQLIKSIGIPQDHNSKQIFIKIKSLVNILAKKCS